MAGLSCFRQACSGVKLWKIVPSAAPAPAASAVPIPVPAPSATTDVAAPEPADTCRRRTRTEGSGIRFTCRTAACQLHILATIVTHQSDHGPIIDTTLLWNHQAQRSAACGLQI